jgi:hypothetical protein
MVSKALVSALGVLGGLLVASTALAAEQAVDSSGVGAGEAQPASGMNNAISLLGNFGYAYGAGTGFGLSGRYQITVVPDGFLKPGTIHDDFGIEPAVDFYHYSWDFYGYSWSYNEIGLSASAIWNLWFTDEFAAYPRLGLGFGFGSWSDNTGVASPGGYGGVFLVGGAGILYALNPITLRAEVSNNSLCLGVALTL